MTNAPAQPVQGESIRDCIDDYLANGGLFNPELATHVAVRDLLIDCRTSLPGWRNISTAPKDWSDVLLYDPERERPIFEGFYSCADGGRDRWMASNDGPWDPTHWMPLPEPPALATQADDTKGGA